MKTYASFFESHDKASKELGVAEELVEALNRGAGLSLHSPQEFSPDPPDCVCLDSKGRAVAIECVEVVCERATRLNAQGHDVYRVWRPGELSVHVSRVLAEKDSKRFHGGPNHGIVVCLFTDEPALAAPVAKAELEASTFGPLKQITAAYLLFSYEPASKSYPLVALWPRHGGTGGARLEA
jgi:hypothetical protein